MSNPRAIAIARSLTRELFSPRISGETKSAVFHHIIAVIDPVCKELDETKEQLEICNEMVERALRDCDGDQKQKR